jgi:16S rRNA G966 N2-methylase RsmD
MAKTEKDKKKNVKNKTVKLLKKPTLEKLSKQQITKILYPITLDQALDSFKQLREIDCKEIKLLDKTGTDFVNHFTSIERLNTNGRLNFSYFDVYYNFNDYYNNKPYFRNGINKTFNGRFFKEDNAKKTKMLKSLFTLYFGNIGVFRPILVKDMICRYKPKVFLDFTMGWGGRLVGACSENIEKYIGIDLNTNLEPLYKKMVDTLKPMTTTKIQLFFKSALDVDYSKLDYDFVLTSPPYYNIEIYNKNSVIKKEEWENNFYIPVFTVTYKHLKKGGHYCLNVPVNIYEDVCVKVLGKCYDKIPLGKRGRNKKDTYSEYIYIWKK